VQRLLYQNADRRIDFALANINRLFERIEKIEERINTLEYTLSLLSKRIDDLEG
jgi:prefoldin subunit 5